MNFLNELGRPEDKNRDFSGSRQNVWLNRSVATILWCLAAWAGWPYLMRPWALVQFNYNEGWNAYRAREALENALYIHRPRFSITNYPPISFHVIGYLGLVTGDPVVAGRLVSLISLAVICFFIGLIIRTEALSLAACLSGSALFVIMLELYGASYIGVDDPQIFGMTFEVIGLYWLFGRIGSNRGRIFSALFFAVSVFIKHNLVAIPIGSAVGMAQRREWKSLFIWLITTALFCAVFFLITILIDGRYFLDDILWPRAYSIRGALNSSISYIIVTFPFFIISFIWSIRNINSTLRRCLLSYSWFFSNIVGMLFSGGDGVSKNIMFEALLLDAVIVVLAFPDQLQHRSRIRILASVLVLVLLTLVPCDLLVYREMNAVSVWRKMPLLNKQFTAGVDELKAAHGPVVCENLLMCFRANRKSMFDPYFVMDQIKIGKISSLKITDLVRNQKLAAVEIGATEMPDPKKQIRFTSSFLRALRRYYHVVMETPQFTIWQPDGKHIKERSLAIQ